MTDMNDQSLRPMWIPRLEVGEEWTLAHLKKYLAGQSFTLYAHGTCVVWIEPGELASADATRRLHSVTAGHPDFKVRRHPDGNFLITFRGGVAGLMSGELLQANLEALRDEAFSLGRLPSERLSADRHDEGEALDLIAGLYVRAQLYRDADEQHVVATVKR